MRSVAKTIEISAESDQGFEDAIRLGVERATGTIKDVTGAWIKEQQVVIKDGRIAGYRVHIKVTFVLND